METQELSSVPLGAWPWDKGQTWPSPGGQKSCANSSGTGETPNFYPQRGQGWCLSCSWCPQALSSLRTQILCPCALGLVSLSAQNKL